MRSIRNIFVIVLVLVATVGSAQVDALKTTADQAYIDGNYEDAIVSYEEILAQQYVSAEVYYNLGNAYFKAGKVASSVLNFERALKLAPHDDDIQFNLKLANLSVKDRIEEMPKLFFVTWWEALLKTFSTDGWAWSIIISVLLGLGGLLLFKFSNEEGMKRLTFYTALISFAWAGLSAYAAETNYNHAVNDNRAVVFIATINAKSAPDQKGKDLFVIHEGLVVEVTDRLNGWCRIKLSNGNVGWIPEKELTRI